ncbi:hypothetical protein LRD18_10915 [Halorhodospira halochloris]|uniref:hypothetical protein n=1 Tax=Halorhodospira halochloris TaxID=1052 RepID=UPI001EE85B49|nr:hypothetical protein [Halorhodospira halochloris]MCG5531358.1 hypothetical protein [Halorhodospira halochloris]
MDERDLQRWALDRATDEVIDRATSSADGGEDKEERQDRQDRELEEVDRTVEAGQCTEEQIAKMIQQDISREVIDHVCASDTDAVATSEEDDSEDEEKDVDLEEERLAEVSDEEDVVEEDVEEGVNTEPETTSAEPYKEPDHPPRHAIGVGLHNHGISTSRDHRDSYSLTGFGVTWRGAWHQYWATDLAYYSVEDSEHNKESSGVEGMIWLGTNMLQEGWYFSVGGGLYNDNWSGSRWGFKAGRRGESLGVEFEFSPREVPEEMDLMGAENFNTGSLKMMLNF